MKSQKNLYLCLLFLLSLFSKSAFATDDHLLLCEVLVTPTESEFIEIVNPTAFPISLDNYYISDDEDYAYLPGKFGDGPTPSIGSSDFIAQFPPGSTIPAMGVITIALAGVGFEVAFGFPAG
ncbi:MAG: hypothetical protein HRU38_13200, partial [Saccharospirillaceae bacterium]|nr:hypothetical protein [Saccharospirillaceae bacterium]